VTHALAIPLAAPPGAWGLWLTVVAIGVMAGLLLLWLRRWLLRPMRHRPSSTTDAWTEAGRRFRVTDQVQDDDSSSGGNGDSA